MASRDARMGTLRKWHMLALVAIVTPLLLSGCNDDMSDLQSYVHKVKQRPGGRIEAIPEMDPFDTYAYPADPGRSPFQVLSFAEPEEEKAREAADTGPKPDRSRPHEALEDYQLDSLRYVGTLQRSGRLWGLVRDPGGTIHRVQPGNYLGTNYGKVTGISPAAIEVRELIPNERGGWIERDASVAIND